MLNAIPIERNKANNNIKKEYSIVQAPTKAKYSVEQKVTENTYILGKDPTSQKYSLTKDDTAVNSILKVEEDKVNDFEKLENVQQINIIDETGEEKSTSEIAKAFRELGDTKNVFQRETEGNIQPPNIELQQTSRKISVSYNESQDKFTFYGVNNTILGYFTTEQLVKYLGNVYDTKNQFLNYLEEKSMKDAKEIIKTFIFKIKYNKDDKICSFDFHDSASSGFMGDIELLIKLNNSLHRFQMGKMRQELSSVEKPASQNIERNIFSFIFLLLNYTLQLIGIITEMIKNDPSKNVLRESMLKYAIGITHRISMFVQGQLKIVAEDSRKIEELIKKSGEMKTDMTLKILNFVNSQTQRPQQIPIHINTPNTQNSQSQFSAVF